MEYHEVFSGSTELIIWLVVIVAISYNIFKFLNKGIYGFLGNIMGYFPTVVHELGHVIGCKMFFGKVNDIVLVHSRKNQIKGGAYGYAVTYNKGKIPRIVKAYLGYIFPPLIALLFVYLNKAEMLPVAFILIFVGLLYLLIKTSNKLPILANIIVVIGLVYVAMDNGVDINGELIMAVVFSILIGLLIGETLFSLHNIFNLWLRRNVGWDGDIIKEISGIPIIFSLMLWFIGITYIMYNIVLLVI